jgi:anti-anti-sigma factor
VASFGVVIERVGPVGVLRISGDIDRRASEDLPAAYGAAAEGATEVLLDLTDVAYINSTGIALIVGLLAKAKADGVSIGACGLTYHYQKVFEVTRLADFLHIYPDATAAVGGPAPASS